MRQRPLRFTIERQGDPRVRILTVVGNQRLSLVDVNRAIAASLREPPDPTPAQRVVAVLGAGRSAALPRSQYHPAGGNVELRGLRPEHFRGWGPINLYRVIGNPRRDTVMTDFHGAELRDLAVVGSEPPSPDRLAELLVHERLGVRLLAITWMAPLVEPG